MSEKNIEKLMRTRLNSCKDRRIVCFHSMTLDNFMEMLEKGAPPGKAYSESKFPFYKSSRYGEIEVMPVKNKALYVSAEMEPDIRSRSFKLAEENALSLSRIDFLKKKFGFEINGIDDLEDAILFDSTYELWGTMDEHREMISHEDYGNLLGKIMMRGYSLEEVNDAYVSALENASGIVLGYSSGVFRKDAKPLPAPTMVRILNPRLRDIVSIDPVGEKAGYLLQDLRLK